MSKVFGLPVQFNEHVTFLKDTTFYGNLNINNAQFLGNATFTGDVTIQKDLDVLGLTSVTDLYVRKTFGVGIGSTALYVDGPNAKIGISSSEPREFIDIPLNPHIGTEGSFLGSNDIVIQQPFIHYHNDEDRSKKRHPVYRGGVIGLGTDTPAFAIRGGVGFPTAYTFNSLGLNAGDYDTKLDIAGNVAISKFIIDSDNLPGINGAYLSMDQDGVQWVSTQPEQTMGIKIQNNGTFINAVGVAQTFDTINIIEGNSGGVGEDNLTAIHRNIDADNVVTFVAMDYWGNAGDGDIYRMSQVGINIQNAAYDLHVNGTMGVEDNATFNQNIGVSGQGNFNSTQDSTDVSTGSVVVSGGVGIALKLNVGGLTKILNTQTSAASNEGALVVSGGVGLGENLNIAGLVKVENSQQSTLFNTGALVVSGGVGVGGNLNIQQNLKVTGTTTLEEITHITKDNQSSSVDTGALQVDGGVGINKNLNVGENTKLTGSLELENSILDKHNSIGPVGRDYRLSSIGAGVSWRPSGVETLKTIWVSESGDDSNSGLLEGDAKRTIGAAAEIAQEKDTIVIRPGTYDENNPIGLRTDVSVTGQDLRLVTVRPQNLERDVFHVRRGCLIENLNFSCNGGVSVANTGGGAVAFPPTQADIAAGIAHQAVSGFTAVGPADEGLTGRWRSPYVRNCTNFMSKSIGMKINGNHASVRDPANNAGNDLKSMVCDSFTQYNEAGVGVSITNNAYAQLVSIFTINSDIGIYVDTGGSCDLTNSNSSFGNYGLYAVGLGATEYTGFTTSIDTPAEIDTVVATGLTDYSNNPRRPYDGQALWFNIDLSDYPDAVGTGRINAPLQELSEIKLIEGAVGNSGFSETNPPNILILDQADNLQDPKGPQGIIAEGSATVDENGVITEIDIVRSGRNYLSTQNMIIDIEGNTGIATAVMKPIYFTVFESTEVTQTGITTITLNEIVPYELPANTPIELRRISRILTSSHSFEYIGTGTSINTALPFIGALPIKENEVVALDGAQIPFTSTDQKGNFDIGDGIQVNQTTSTVSGRDFSRAIQAEVTPLILALR